MEKATNDMNEISKLLHSIVNGECTIRKIDLQVTPYFISEQAAIDWMRLMETYDALSEDRKRVADVIGFEPAFVSKCIRVSTANCFIADDSS